MAGNRGAAALVALVDAGAALVPKAVAYVLLQATALTSPVGGTDWLLAVAAAFSLFVLAPYSYREYRSRSRPLAVTRTTLDRARQVVATA